MIASFLFTDIFSPGRQTAKRIVYLKEAREKKLSFFFQEGDRKYNPWIMRSNNLEALLCRFIANTIHQP